MHRIHSLRNWALRSLRAATSTLGSVAGVASEADDPAQTAGGAAELDSGSEDEGSSVEAQAYNSIERQSKRARLDNDGATSAQIAAAAASEPSAFSLPIELLVEIFLYLTTSDVAQAAQVSQPWHTASTDPRIWRHLSFTRVEFVDWASTDEELELRQRFASLGAKCGNTVESVDFGNLWGASLKLLAEGLFASTQTLKHIRWSSEKGREVEAMRFVAFLSRLCPRLETLELRTWDKCHGVDLIGSPHALRWSHSFSLTSAGVDGLYDIPQRLNMKPVFDRATTLEFKLTRSESLGLELVQLAFLLRNRAVERLTVHGLWAGSLASNVAISLSAPLLTFLDLRSSKGELQQLLSLDAPQLRELSIDAHLLPRLTIASTPMLSSLTLHINSMITSDVLASLRDYHGSLKLIVARHPPEEVVDLLLQGFMWPGLEDVEMEVTESTIAELICVIAARQAGANGASERECLLLLYDASTRLVEAGFDGSCLEGPAWLEAHDILATASAFQLDGGTLPVCAQMHWKLSASTEMLGCVLSWLEGQPNVDVEKVHSA